MRLSNFLSLGMTFAGGVAASRVLRRRHRWEQEQRSVVICIDFDDVTDAAIRAAVPFEQLLQHLIDAGATHISLPELTLDRLLQQGRLAPQAPARPLAEPPPLGHWNYLHGPAKLVRALANEMCERFPHTEPRILQDTTLAFAGNLPALRYIGLGFDDEAATRIAGQGLGLVPRPTSYDWPDPALLRRTLSQAAQHGELIAFAGDMVLGHEMHLDETVAALARHNLTFVYFARSRHQKGDWFVAKRRAPHVVLGHRFSPAEMIPLDYHAAAHNWAHLAREHGIRLCYLNFFRVLHATEPLEAIHYVEHVRASLQDAGFTVDVRLPQPQTEPGPEPAELALTSLAPAGIGAAMLARTLQLPEAAAVPLTVGAAGAAGALPFLEKLWHQRTAHGRENGSAKDDGAAGHRHDHSQHAHEEHDDHHDHGYNHHHDHAPSLQSLYTPSYSPKLLALATATLAPLLALETDGAEADQLWRLTLPPAAAAVLAAATSDRQYLLRIEEYRAFGLDWLLPLGGAALQIGDRRARLASLVGLLAAWLLARRQGDADLLAAFDAPHPLGHTHHISAAARFFGDLGIWLGPRPARKWAAVTPLALAARNVLSDRQSREPASVAGAIAAASLALTLSAFRQPQRHLALTTGSAAPAYALSAALATVLEGLGP